MHNPDAKDWDEIGTTSLGSLTNLPKVRMASRAEYAVKYFPMQVYQVGDGQQKLELSKLFDNIFNLTRLDHPNLVRVREVRKMPLDAKVAAFYELVEGSCDLEELVKKRAATGGMQENEIKLIAKQICRGLEYLHSKGVIHRFLNSTNVIVTMEGDLVKLLDFGISVNLVDNSSKQASHSCPRGIPNYMAPELVVHTESSGVVYSRGSDIWALGCLLYEMAVGRRPHSHCCNFGAMSIAISETGAPDLPEKCSLALKNFYAACTCRDSGKRESAAQLLEFEFLA